MSWLKKRIQSFRNWRTSKKTNRKTNTKTKRKTNNKTKRTLVGENNFFSSNANVERNKKIKELESDIAILTHRLKMVSQESGDLTTYSNRYNNNYYRKRKEDLEDQATKLSDELEKALKALKALKA